jgi:hypothetical protein
VSGANNFEFEITPEGGEPIVGQRQILVEGSDEAVAYIASVSNSSSNRSSWIWVVCTSAVVAGSMMLFFAGRRRRRRQN